MFFSIVINMMYQQAIFTTKYALQDIYECSGFSSCVAILCVYDESRSRW